MQACQLARFAVEGTSVQGLGHSVEVARRAQPAEAVAHTLNFHLESLLFGQVIEGPHDALPWRASGLDRVLQVEVKPRSGLLGTVEQGVQKDAPLTGEAASKPRAEQRSPSLLGRMASPKPAGSK